ncbi:hypothetical protein ANN_15884 [Periplaneta americana]|uniref:Uncharacterized protein n=1 Tax=Periplaneta americana TaxID=6978 RepID=A0ABQ8SJE4_PERAM|nr:hypothetical protein ANN_15884 [Periplaneta americana]
MEEGLFTRELDINSCGKSTSLTLYQKEVGDVSCVVWDAAIVLAKYLETRCNNTPNWLRGRTAVELGGGLGCVGLTAACFGADVTITDLPEVIPLMQKNAEANRTVWSTSGGKVCTKILQWGSELPEWKIPDIVLLADCVYYEESVEPLVKTLYNLTDADTEVFLSQEKRDSEKQQMVWKMFQELLQKHFEITMVPEEEHHPEFCCPDIVVLRARKKS